MNLMGEFFDYPYRHWVWALKEPLLPPLLVKPLVRMDTVVRRDVLLDVEADDTNDRLHKIARAVKRTIARTGVVVPENAVLEISHHYGIEDFEKNGIAMFTLVNRAYCKKMLFMLPGQRHPEQYHNLKEETFIVLSGEMLLRLDGEERTVKKGDVVTIEPGVRHEMSTGGADNGVVFEEISTTHNAGDSFYTDPKIGMNGYRKTFLHNWAYVSL